MKRICFASLVWFLLVGMAYGEGLPTTRLKASDPATWKPVRDQAVVPTGGVTLADTGLFKAAFENNIRYLLNSFSNDHMLVPFRLRAGQQNPPDDREQEKFWDTELRGSGAGRFLMGAGNALRWGDYPELRKRLDDLIDGIEACRGPNGYILAYPPDELRAEEPNYARAWFVHGLIEAGIAGNPKAYGLLRGHADWFNQWDMLPKLINCCGNAHQGHIASTRTYLSPIGKPEDLQVAEKYYVLDWWLQELTARHGDCIWKYPLQGPHCYLVTSFEAYLDHYRAKGDPAFLEAMRGAWELIHDNWEHVGGSMALCEGEIKHPPQSYYLAPKACTGETCGSVFWIKFNQRLHLLYPTEEKYVGEIEKSIYNVCLANQVADRSIRSFARMEGGKDNPPKAVNTCCEGQGTRFFGSLPEYIFSRDDDGVYVNLYEPATIRWKQAGQEVELTSKGSFPVNSNVLFLVHTAQPVAMKLRVRIPAWAAQEVRLVVNGQLAAVGQPGSYVTLDRTWSDNDSVGFYLPIELRMTRYHGLDEVAGQERYALEYGPILMAVAGPLDKERHVTLPYAAADLRHWLKAKPEQPLHFTIQNDAEHEYLPYWQIDRQKFCVYPILAPAAESK